MIVSYLLPINVAYYVLFIDVDECSASISVCDVNASCQNTRGSYVCSCKAGFTGDGKTCTGKRSVWVWRDRW